MDRMLGNKMAITIFSLPALIIYTLFVFAATLRVGIGSLYDWDGVLAGKFVGFRQYTRLFTDDVFYISLKNGFIAAFILFLLQFCLGLVLALILSEKEIKYRKALRISYFIPVVLSVTVGCLLGISVLLSDGGLLNNIIHAMGISYSQSWLSNPKTAIIPVSVINSWQYMGLYLSLFYAGIKSIPVHYYEAAIIDGASKIKTYIHITIPLLREVMKICFLFAMLGGLNQFVHNLIVTAGGPGESTYSLTLLMYQRAFGSTDYGYGSAVAVVIVIQALLVAMVINKFIAREKITY